MKVKKRHLTLGFHKIIIYYINRVSVFICDVSKAASYIVIELYTNNERGRFFNFNIKEHIKVAEELKFCSSGPHVSFSNR